MQNKFWRTVIAVFAAMLVLTSAAAAAKKPVALDYFQISTLKENGNEILRVEIGSDSAASFQYDVSTKPYLKRQVIVDIKDSRPKKIKRETDPKSSLVNLVTVTEGENRSTRVAVNMVGAVLYGSYKVYALDADAKAKKPARIVIDIKATPDDDYAAAGAEGAKGHTVVIDPGHGGSDTGAIGPSGVTEKEVALAVAKKVRSSLAASGANVIMTRETDRDVYGPDASANQELQARVNAQLRVPSSEIFVSIHCNAFTNPATHGMETYCFSGSSNGYRLAALLNEELAKAGGLENRGVRTANFYVLKYSSVPAALVELAFITNPAEEKLLASNEWQNKAASAIAKAIGRYFSR